MTDTKLMMDDRISRYASVIDDISFPTVTEWKNSNPGGKIVGMFPVYTPHELAHSLGMLPVGVYGAGGRIEIDHADSRIQSFVCSIARSTLELGLTERLKGFDAMWFTSICDVARNLSGVWQTNFPDQLVEYIHFPQNIDSPAAVVHYRTELSRLVSNLEGLVGKKSSTSDLNESIKIFNRNRDLSKKLYSIRDESPWLLSAYESYVLLRMGTLIPVEEHNRVLEEVIPEISGRNRRQRDYVRVILEGSFCEQPPFELLQVLEDSGCYVVNDDILLNLRWFNEPVPITDDPLLALATSYLKHSVSSSVRHYGNKSRKYHLAENVKARKADGVIFCAPKFCEPALLDYITMKDEMEKQGIAYISFEYEEKMGVFESIRTQIETFVESVMFFS